LAFGVCGEIMLANSHLLTSFLMPCLFLGIHFPGNHFPHFPIFDKYKENWSKKTQFPVNEKNKALGPESVFLSCF